MLVQYLIKIAVLKESPTYYKESSEKSVAQQNANNPTNCHGKETISTIVVVQLNRLFTFPLFVYQSILLLFLLFFFLFAEIKPFLFSF